ncbi:uncharacterized protein LOC123003763 [Tribolium madens]|uniref:uncharacterized protein LOC123003763 n=1 Tax=Tribolium madens TaxID=41895 RepID=UPI001CF74D6D|nr:uncharacterized protein LOC123003763 [Tribolium madens]
MAAQTVFVGKTFNSYDELTLFVSQYELFQRQKFWKRSSRKISSTPNIKRFINPELIYYEITYSCIHGGEKYKSRSKGLRKSISFRLEAPCNAFIKLRASREGDCLEIKSFNEEHNHDFNQTRWNVAQMEALIEQYKKHPILYNPNHGDYRNTELKKHSLCNIVEALQAVRSGVTEIEIVTQWNNLIAKYSNEITDTNEECHSWYAQKLSFLDHHVDSSVKYEEIFENDEASRSPEIQIKEEIPDSPPPKRDKSPKVECDIFGDFVAAQLKKITSGSVRQDAIFEIHQVLHKALKTEL